MRVTEVVLSITVRVLCMRIVIDDKRKSRNLVRGCGKCWLKKLTVDDTATFKFFCSWLARRLDWRVRNFDRYLERSHDTRGDEMKALYRAHHLRAAKGKSSLR